jgi:hypothetical protein
MLFASLLTAGLLLQPTTQPATPSAEEDAAYVDALIERHLRDTKALPEGSGGSGVLRLVMGDAWLDASVPSDLPEGRFRLDVERPGSTVPAVLRVRKVSREATPRMVELVVWEQAEPVAGDPLRGGGPMTRQLALTADLIGGRVDLVLNAENAAGVYTIHLIQEANDRNAAMTPESDATLHVSILPAGDEPGERLSIKAEDVGRLLTDRPDLALLHVAPALRELGLEPSADELVRRAAAPLLVPDVVPTQADRERVMAALDRVEASGFAERLAARDQLLELGLPGAAVLLSLDRDTLSGDQRQAVDEATAAYRIPMRTDLLKDPRVIEGVRRLSGEEDVILKDALERAIN